MQPLWTYYHQFVISLSKLVLPVKTSRFVSSFFVARPFAETHFLFPNRCFAIPVFRGIQWKRYFLVATCLILAIDESAGDTTVENDFLKLEMELRAVK